MDSQPLHLTLGLLPGPRARWQRFVFSYGAQSLVVAFFVIAAVAYPDVLVLPARDYHFVGLVRLVITPPPVPQAPAPVKHFNVPVPKINETVKPRTQAMCVPPELVQKKPSVPEDQAPTVTLAATKELLPGLKPTIPRPPVKTNVFSNRSSATPTMAAAPQKVQTGGFGDPNGVPASENHGRPITIAQAGSYDMPYGPGSGNGTGGAHGARGAVRQGGFGDAGLVAQPMCSQPKRSPPNPSSNPCRLRSHSSPVRLTRMRGDGLRLRVRFCSVWSFPQRGRFAS